jgi:hypothetical protein
VHEDEGEGKGEGERARVRGRFPIRALIPCVRASSCSLSHTCYF